MILKIREVLNPETCESTGYGKPGMDGWIYYEAPTIAIDWVPDGSSEQMSNSPSLVYCPPEGEYPVHLAHIGQENIWFNTAAYLMNNDGKTIDYFPQIVVCRSGCTHECHQTTPASNSTAQPS